VGANTLAALRRGRGCWRRGARRGGTDQGRGERALAWGAETPGEIGAGEDEEMILLAKS